MIKLKKLEQFADFYLNNSMLYIVIIRCIFYFIRLLIATKCYLFPYATESSSSEMCRPFNITKVHSKNLEKMQKSKEEKWVVVTTCAIAHISNCKYRMISSSYRGKSTLSACTKFSILLLWWNFREGRIHSYCYTNIENLNIF